MMKKTFLKVAVVLLTAVMTISCSKDGAMGPQGPAGLDGTNGTNGTNGATGATGANGTNGANGNANVIGTNTITVTSWTSAVGGSLWSTSLSATGITQSIVDKGIVCVFIGDTSGAWTAMPYTFGNASWCYSFGVGFINIYKTNTNLAAIPNPGSQTFRVVIISASNRMANPNTNWKDYNQVKAVLHLQD